MEKKRILIFIDWFYPGYKAGGPIRSCVNFITVMKEEFSIFLVTGNKDLGDSTPYTGVKFNEWSDFQNGGAKVLYLDEEHAKYKTIKKQIREINPGFIYLQSLFSIKFTFFPLLAARKTKQLHKIVMAPRGMLHKGALQYKPRKKKTYIQLLKTLGIAKSINYQATDDEELKDIFHWMKAKKNQVSLMANFPEQKQRVWTSTPKQIGIAKMVFISRVSPKKNLSYFLDRLLELDTQAEITFDIYGPIEEEKYWNECEEKINKLPANCTVQYCGILENQKLPETFRQYHFYALTTFGENFGHSIFEAFVAGKPVIISDTTPWKNLEARQIGWCFPLDQPEKFAKAITAAASMDQTMYNKWSKKAWEFAKQYKNNPKLKANYIKMFSKNEG